MALTWISSNAVTFSSTDITSSAITYGEKINKDYSFLHAMYYLQKYHHPDPSAVKINQERNRARGDQTKASYTAFRVPVLDIEELHGLYHRLHRLEGVLEDDLDEASLFRVGVAASMDDSHLLDEGGLPRLASPCVGVIYINDPKNKTNL